MNRRQNREIAVVLSPGEYKRLRGMNISEFEQFCNKVGADAASRGLTEKKLAEILSE